LVKKTACAAGAATIFFAGCNLRCVFCQNFETSWRVEGDLASPRKLALMMLELEERDCHNINFVTPEHVVPQILEALLIAVEEGLLEVGDLETTRCPGCHELLVGRSGYRITDYRVTVDGRCPKCARAIAGRWDPVFRPQLADRPYVPAHHRLM
jgi:uncharacterized Fe-S cluster-containing radical SAM superfamily protein